MKNLFSAVGSVLAIGACSSAQADKLNANDDLHCSVVSYYFARSGPPKSDDDARASFIASAWYDKRVGNTPDLKKAAPVLQKVRDDPATAQRTAADCIERALRDPAFERFARDATEAWNRTAQAGATPSR